MSTPVNTTEIQHTGFKPGQSGNPKGRPRGARNKTTLAVEALLDGEAEAITRACIDQALAGNMTAMKLVLERICPPRKERPISVKLPKISSAQDLSKLTAALLNSVAAGEIEPGQAGALATLIVAHGRALQTVEIERKINNLLESDAFNKMLNIPSPRDILNEMVKKESGKDVTDLLAERF